MYKQVPAHSEFTDKHGNVHTPVATLEDEYGGVCHIIEDDHCYVLYLKAVSFKSVPKGCLDIQDGVWFRRITHIFREAHELLKSLPTLS